MKNTIIFFLLAFTTFVNAQGIRFTANGLIANDPNATNFLGGQATINALTSDYFDGGVFASYLGAEQRYSSPMHNPSSSLRHNPNFLVSQDLWSGGLEASAYFTKRKIFGANAKLFASHLINNFPEATFKSNWFGISIGTIVNLPMGSWLNLTGILDYTFSYKGGTDYFQEHNGKLYKVGESFGGLSARIGFSINFNPPEPKPVVKEYHHYHETRTEKIIHHTPKEIHTNTHTETIKEKTVYKTKSHKFNNYGLPVYSLKQVLELIPSKLYNFNPRTKVNSVSDAKKAFTFIPKRKSLSKKDHLKDALNNHSWFLAAPSDLDEYTEKGSFSIVQGDACAKDTYVSYFRARKIYLTKVGDPHRIKFLVKGIVNFKPGRQFLFLQNEEYFFFWRIEKGFVKRLEIIK